MRVWGYVLLILGTLLLLLFGMAKLGGGHVGVLPLLISVFVLAMGWSFVRSGRPIVQTHAPPGAQSVPSTAEMPMSPEIAAVIARQSARGWRRLLYVAGGLTVAIAFIGVLIDVFDRTPGEGITMLGAFTAVGLASGLMIVGISWLGMQMPVRRDLRAPRYLRTTGAVEVVAIPFSTGAMLRLSDRAFLMNDPAAIRALGSVKAGTVDYTPFGHVILAAWDSQGRLAYGAPGYDAEPSR
ncbi:MAG: hypothetical protein ACYC8W_00760 [Candidatus Tyrphobacter sp.]